MITGNPQVLPVAQGPGTGGPVEQPTPTQGKKDAIQPRTRMGGSIPQHSMRRLILVNLGEPTQKGLSGAGKRVFMRAGTPRIIAPVIGKSGEVEVPKEDMHNAGDPRWERPNMLQDPKSDMGRRGSR